jgi:hypothetical protein
MTWIFYLYTDVYNRTKFDQLQPNMAKDRPRSSLARFSSLNLAVAATNRSPSSLPKGTTVTDIAIRALAVALCAATALIVGLAAGILAFANGTRPAGAALAGGGAFVVTMPVALSVAAVLGGW